MRRDRFRRAVTGASVILTLGLATIAGCQPDETGPPSVDELLRQTGIWQRPTLRIGVAANEPLIGEIKEGVRSGFDVEIARYLARSLGYTNESDVEFVTVRTDERIRFLLAGHVDIVVASLSYTEDRAKLIGMAGPYFVTNQAFLVPKASAPTLRTEDDFKEKKVKVCTSGSSTTEDELTRRGFDRSVVQDLQDCADGMLSGEYGAMSSDKTILAGYYSQHPQDFAYVQLPFGADERLHVGVSINDEALRDLVAYFLKKSYDEGRETGTSPWLTAYNNTLGAWYLADVDEISQPEPLDVPDLVDHDDKVSPR
ncbi:glutamate transport system substrate-binding protein [Catenuloplanes nepalensis]|uniref:Glutamate transport system substrate-binding protein n=1 Tax=Catenuloplanes nepalensis TaxID=587533 RepID=A0ABT9MNA0_9ACTN|nr:transporter substrate-binding domain-containing protein [Catenuloplanes nepalensis]MDP9792811.1 glutamate transport system substrate-binding protein [Catenuloplanes nepalensis]